MTQQTQIKKKQKSAWKRLAGVLHLWLGLLSGIIVFIIAVTGCIYVFQDEIKDVVYDWRFVQPQEKAFVPPSIIFDQVKQHYPVITANMVVYQNGSRPASVYVQLDGIPHNIYLNPYSSGITHLQNLDSDFFMTIERLHRFLLLPEAIGKQVTGVATIIFLIMLSSGLILWWPKKWKTAGQNFKVKWKARWRRKNYDWHRATGFYMILPAIVMAITGLAFTYEWVHDGLFAVGNLGSNEPEFVAPTAFAEIKKTEEDALDLAFAKTTQLAPASGMLFVWDQGDGLPILTGAYPKSLNFDHQSNFYFHPKTGALLKSQFYNTKSGGLQLQEMNFGLHTGQYLGVFGKIMAFITSLFIASLPITGVMIWWGRRNKKFIKI